MAQSFITTYKNHYRHPELHHTQSLKPKDLYDGSFPDEEFFYKFSRISGEEMSPEEINKWIYDLYMKRYETTYQHFYCRDLAKKSTRERKYLLDDNLIKDVDKKREESGSSLGNELLEYCRSLYEPSRKKQVAPPLPGTRKNLDWVSVFGYIRPSRNYTPLTNYQFYMGKTAYDVLKGDYKWGADRLALQVADAPPEKNASRTRSAEASAYIEKMQEKNCCCSCNKIKHRLTG